MRPRISAVSIVLLMFAGVANAQAPQAQKPGPEIKRLHYFVGTWNTEYTVKPGPMGPGGKNNAVDQSRMMPGGFFLETRTDGNGSMGVFKGVSIMGYDAAAKAYTYDAFNNFGEADHFKGTVQGDTWTWTSEREMAGKPTKMRFTAKEVSPSMYTIKFEFATDGDWTTVMEGKSSKKATSPTK